MKITTHIANHLREVYFGGNWTVSNLKETLSDVSWEEAVKSVGDLNTIATLVYHITYFVTAGRKVLEGGPLDAHDKYSFSHPPINSQADWEKMLSDIWEEGDIFATLIGELSEDQLQEVFEDEKYGSYYRNLHGTIEHFHYHLGQIAIIKKLLRSS